MESSSTIQPPPPYWREPRLHTAVLPLGTNCPHPLPLGHVCLTECGVEMSSLVEVSKNWHSKKISLLFPTAICPDLTLTNGFISYNPATSPILDGAMATHSCVTGYQLSLSPATRTCLSNRMWSGDDITCQRVLCVLSCLTLDNCISCAVICPDLTLTNGQVLYSDTTPPRAVDSTATYSCVTGYQINGTEARMCTDSGWSGTSSSCTGWKLFLNRYSVHEVLVFTVVNCGPLIAPTNGKVMTTAGNIYQSTATYSCNTGYTLNGGPTRTCAASGTWSEPVPSCNREYTVYMYH